MGNFKNFLKKNKVRLGILLAFAFILIFFITKLNKKSDSKYQVYTVKKTNLKDELVLSGEVKAERQEILKFKTSGKLAWVGVREGDRVKKGQAIALLDRRVLEKEFRKYMNYYLKTRWNFEQTKEDYKDFEVWNISDEEKNRIKRIVEKAQFDLNNSVLDVEIKDLALKDSVITAPFDGIITKVSVPVAGVFITPQEATFELTDPTSLYFSVSADQTEVVKLKEGEKGEIIFDVFPEKPVKGKIYYISFTPREDETGSVYEVKIKIDKKPSFLRVGLTGDFKIIAGEKKGVLAIPLGYVQEDKKGFYVLKRLEGELKKQYIKGEEFADSFVVYSGLKEGDKVLQEVK